jgi:maltose O-acetyltransferase
LHPFIEVGNYLRDLFLNRCIASALLPKRLRWRALRLAGLDVAESTIAPGTFFGSSRVRIGRGCYISYDCFFDSLEQITLGERVDLAMGVLLITSSHHLGPPRRRAGASKRAPITIGDGAWIGARAMILPGVTIGAGAVIAAGSVVRGDCEPNTLYAGVPAVAVEKLRDPDDAARSGVSTPPAP